MFNYNFGFVFFFSGILSPPGPFLTPSPSPSIPASPRLQPSPSISPFQQDVLLVQNNTITNTTQEQVSIFFIYLRIEAKVFQNQSSENYKTQKTTNPRKPPKMYNTKTEL